MTGSLKYYSRLLWITFFVTAVLCVVFAYYGFPVLTYDSQCFLPVAASLKNGNGLVNPFYDAGFIPGGKFLFYPPLFPVAMYLLMWGSGASAMYSSILLVNLITLFIATLIFQQLLNKYNSTGKKSFWFLLIVIFWLPANCTFIIPNNSRPEMLCRLLLYAIILLQLTHTRINYFLSGVIYASAFITSPVFGIYLSAIIFLYLIYVSNIKGFAAFATGGAIVFLLFLLFYPYHISELLQTMKVHSSNVIFARNEGFSIKNFLTYHVFANNASFGFLLFLAATCVGMYYFSPVKKVARSLFLISAAALVLLILYFSFRNLPMSYYMYVLSPLFLYLVAYAWFKNSNQLNKAAITLLMIMGSFSFLRLSLSFITNAHKAEYSLVSVNKQFEEYRIMKDKKVAVSNGLWPFFSGSTKCTPSIYSGTNEIDADYIIQQQYASGKLAPDSIPNYELVVNRFDKNNSAISKLISSKYAPFYQYAVYKKK